MDPAGLPLGARYVVDEHVGAGATGMVYLGHLRDDGTPVAIKILRPELAEDPDVVGRFVRERSIVVGVQHPHLVRTLDLVIDGGYAAIVMEWVGGGDLRDDLRAGGPMTEQDAGRVLRQVLSALGAVHAAGVIHRDIKPANVLLDENGAAHLSDFGIGRLVAGNSSTASSELVGTAEYMAPELLRNERATPSVDVYSAGCMFHELLTGRPPFTGGSLAVILLAHLNEPPRRPEGVSDPVWNLLSAMLAKDPADRPTVGQAVAELDRLFPALAAEETTVVAPAPVTVRVERTPEPVSQPVVPPARRRSHVALWAAAVVLTLGLTATAAWLFWPRLDTVAADGPVVPAATSTETTSEATTTARTTTTTTPATTTTEATDVATETTEDSTATTTDPTTETTPPVITSTPPTCPGDPSCPTTPRPPTCPGDPSCTTTPPTPTCPPDCVVPNAPQAPTWQTNPGADTPTWGAPEPNDLAPPVTQYVLTLYDVTSGTSDSQTWTPDQVGVNNFGCLGNLHPEGEAHFYYDVVAVNDIGSGPPATSPDYIGQIC